MNKLSVLCVLCWISLGVVALGQPTEQSSILVTIVPDRELLGVGDSVTCRFTVRNTGDLQVFNLRLVDNYGATVHLATTVLDAGETVSASRSYTLGLADLPGLLHIEVTAQGIDKYNRSVVANAYTRVPTAAVGLNKEASPAAAEPGASVTYTFTVQNRGSISLRVDRIDDDKLGRIDLGGVELSPGDLIRRSVTQSLPLDAMGEVVNTATVYGTARAEGRSVDVQDTSRASVRVVRPSLSLVKTPDKPTARVGETVTYRFVVTNDGALPIEDLVLDDDKLGVVPLPRTALQPGQTLTATAAHRVAEGDLPGPLVNHAVVRGTYRGASGSGPIEARDDATVRLVPPGLENVALEKAVDPDEAAVGQTVTFVITVRNNDAFPRTLRVSDPLLRLEEEITLQPGEVWSRSIPYVIPRGSPNPLTNVVRLTGKGLGTLEAEAVVKVPAPPPGSGDPGTPGGPGGPGGPGQPGFPDDPRNQPWNVSFAQVKVFDTQVLDGAESRLRILDGNYQPITEIPMSGTLYVEVEDPDQNEDPNLRELIFGGWNRDSATGDNALGHERSEHSYPIWPRSRTETTADRLTPGARMMAAASITGVVPTAKIFLWNAQNGSWEQLSLRETAVGSGVFRSTTCIPVSGRGSLNSSPGDTIIAFYQDPSNHSDMAIATVKVAEGGAGGVAPSPDVRVTFDSSTYFPGAMLMVTVTDPAYASSREIRGTGVLVLKDAQGATIKSWDAISTVAGETARFRVTWTLPPTVALGTLQALYTDPADRGRTGQATAQVVAVGPEKVTGIVITPNPFSSQATFSLVAEPAGARAGRIGISVFDLTGRRVGEISGTDTASVSWDGANLRNGAYIYVARVETSVPAHRSWEFRGFVYIKR